MSLIKGWRKVKQVKVYLILVFLISSMIFSGCGSEDEKQQTTENINGTVSAADDFIQIGLYLDINSSAVENKSYTIQDNEIAIVKFNYNGIQCELRGSCSYNGMELAGLEDVETSEDLISTYIDIYPATYFTLKPGRLVTWSADNVNYVLYTYVTAEDKVLDDIISKVTFEDHYSERQDVVIAEEEGSVEFARQLVEIVANSDMEALSQLLKYPQMISNGNSAGNIEEFMSIPVNDIFTEGLKNAVDDVAVDELRLSEDGEEEYILGTNYKNIHFIYSDGRFIVTKINN